MGAKKRMKKAAEDLERAVESTATPEPAPATAPLSGTHPAGGELRELNPDPGNRAGVRDTAGDRVDHG